MIADRLSVVVITHNRKDELLATLRRLAELPEQPPVVVVDNGSTDGTSEAVRRSFPGVTVIEPGVNLGAPGRNLGVAAAGTDYVAFCDDDTWYEPGALARGVDLLDRHPDLAVITGKIIVEPDGRVDGICEEMAGSPLPRQARLPGHPLLSFLAGVSIVRRSAFEQAGGFSRQLWLGGEEELLASDLIRAGWHLAYVPDVVTHHHPSVARDSHLRRRHGIRNTLWFTWTRRPLARAARRTWRLARNVPKDAVSLGGALDALRGIGWVLRNRDAVPPHMEDWYQLLEDDQVGGRNRRYVS